MNLLVSVIVRFRLCVDTIRSRSRHMFHVCVLRKKVHLGIRARVSLGSSCCRPFWPPHIVGVSAFSTSGATILLRFRERPYCSSCSFPKFAYFPHLMRSYPKAKHIVSSPDLHACARTHAIFARKSPLSLICQPISVKNSKPKQSFTARIFSPWKKKRRKKNNHRRGGNNSRVTAATQGKSTFSLHEKAELSHRSLSGASDRVCFCIRRIGSVSRTILDT